MSRAAGAAMIDNNEFSGVKLDKRTNKWRARYTAKSTLKRVWLSKLFDNAADAARARDVAAFQFSTPGTKLNFPGEVAALVAKNVATKQANEEKNAAKKSAKKAATPIKAAQASGLTPEEAKDAARKAATNKTPKAAATTPASKKRKQKKKTPAPSAASLAATSARKAKSKPIAVPMEMSSEDDDSEAEPEVATPVQKKTAVKKAKLKPVVVPMEMSSEDESEDEQVIATPVQKKQSAKKAKVATPSTKPNALADMLLALAEQARQGSTDGSTLEALLSSQSGPAVALVHAALQIEKKAAVDAEQYELAQALKDRIERVSKHLVATPVTKRKRSESASEATQSVKKTPKQARKEAAAAAAAAVTPSEVKKTSKQARKEAAAAAAAAAAKRSSAPPSVKKTIQQVIEEAQAAAAAATPATPTQSAKKTHKQVRVEKAAAKAAAALVAAPVTPAQKKVSETPTPEVVNVPHTFLRRDAVKELKRLVTFCAESNQYQSDYADLRKGAETGANELIATAVLGHSVDKLANKKVRLLALDCEMVTGERRVKRVVKGPKPSITRSKKKSPKKRGRASSSSSDSSSSESSELSESSSDTDDEANGRSPSAGRGKFEQVQVLARVSLVDVPVIDAEEGVKEPGRESSRVLIDAYVKPPTDMRIVDYLTHVSGVKEEHLDNATQSLDEIRALVMDQLGPNDILVGHSLNCDLSALKLWHGLILDTSMFFSVKDAPQLTLSLKDVVTMTIGGDKAGSAKVATGFQLEGESHDSVKDAEAAARVVLQVTADRIASAKNKQQQALPKELLRVPERYEKQVRVYNLPNGQTEDSILQLFAPGFSSSKVAKRLAAVTVKPIKWTVMKDGKRVGSTVLTFDSPDHALEGFNGVKINEDVCHKDGFPDSSGFQKKYVRIADAGSKEEKADGGRRIDVVTYYRMPELDEAPVRVLHVHQNALGKVLGPGGKRIISLQQRTGTRVRVEKIAPHGASAKKSKVPGGKGGKEASTAFTVRTDSDLKAMNALKGIHAALKGDKLGIEDSPK